MKPKLLLVDDEPHILEALSFLISRNGYETKTASNAEEALGILDQFVPNVVLLDVMMPGMDGFELARSIREREELEQTRIVFLTAKGTRKDRFDGYGAGGEVYLTKPFDNDTLLDTIEELLRYG